MAMGKLTGDGTLAESATLDMAAALKMMGYSKGGGGHGVYGLYLTIGSQLQTV
jgi:hypothetical protein